MEYNTRHPLETITNSHALSMLEILIPYVDYPLKLPLALLIKFQEIQLIVRVFQSPQELLQYGLHNTSTSMTDMLCSLTGISPEMLNMILSFAENSDGLNSMFSNSMDNSAFQDNFSKMFHQMNSRNEFPLYENHSHSNKEPPPFKEDSDSSEEFDSNIARILSEYDLEQATHFSYEQP